MTDCWGISCKIALRWMPLDLTDDKSTLVQVMAWCRQATSHYLSQCWPRSLVPYDVTRPQWVNTLRPRQNGRHFPDDIFKCIFLNENIWISIKMWLKFLVKGPINNIPVLVQIMAWPRPDNKPQSEPMMVEFTDIYVSLGLNELRKHENVFAFRWVSARKT